MDISVYIGELLYKHDCVIIPGFGGLLCNYQPAVIYTENNSISPPCRAVSFNRNLQNNDGLLANHISERTGLSFYDASGAIDAWVNFSNALLGGKEELVLKNVGRFLNDEEGNLQFEPAATANYLKSSFGLRIITAIPVVKGKQINLAIARLQRRKRSRTMRYWRIAAAVVIIACISSLTTMMWMGVQVKGLKLDEAGVAGFVNSIFKTEEYILKPVPVEMESELLTMPNDSFTIAEAEPETNNTVTSPTTPPGVTTEAPVITTPAPATPPVKVVIPVIINNNSGTSYYVIIGAFKEGQNAENAKKKLLERFPEQNILFEKGSALTKVGYFAGNDAVIAKEQLDSAHREDNSYWLMKK